MKRFTIHSLGAALLLSSVVAAQTPSELAALKLRTIGPANMSGRTVDIAVVEKDPYIIYAATATGGIWRTKDNGTTWAPVFENEATHAVGTITIFQPNPDILWVGTGERANRQSASWGDGIYKSTDAGKTWANVGLRDSRHIGRIATHPSNPDIVWVAVMGNLFAPNKERGLFKTTDGGKTWRNTLFVDEDTGVVDVAVDPSDPSIVYAASHQRRRTAYGFHGGGPGAALWKSTDGGETFRKLTNGLPPGEYGRIGISIYRKDPRIVYVCIEQGSGYNASTEYAVYEAGVFRSDDKGESWKHMSNWNPRPTYGSQIMVDPSDDQRVYMENPFSFSDDGGKTFKVPPQSLHGDDRYVWVDPKDSRHLIKADDGGVGISYDRGLKWLYVSSLPVSQWYRVAVDMQRPFWVYGGLQDNGSWAGPSATPYSGGILNEDWIRTNGGDGFFSVPEPDGREVYSNGQYLTLNRFNFKTREGRVIRPWNNPLGEAPKLGNWGPPKPLVGDFTSPANWDAPIIMSPHDTKTLYAGMRHLFRSRDRGESWTDLGDLSTGDDRRNLKIMGQSPDERTLSLDDGVPYYATITALAESPLRKGWVYAGTDDGNVQISTNEGATFTNVAANVTGLPKSSWIAGIEASRHTAGLIYLVADNHRNGDDANYVFKSMDNGKTWASIEGDLPKNRSLHTLREDPKNPNLLYLGSEFGLFLSFDGGKHWTELKNNMPRMAFYDLVIHPRDNDLVLATHNRGIWILDNVHALQELSAEVRAKAAHIFTIEEAEEVRLTNPKAHAGDLIFRGENPPNGAIIDYWLKAANPASIALTIHDASGVEVAKVEPTKSQGVNRVVWNLRHPGLPAQTYRYMDSERARPISGALVLPGEYTARMVADGVTVEKKFRVIDDRRLNVTLAARAAWNKALATLAASYQTATDLIEKTKADVDKTTYQTAVQAQARIAGVYGNVTASTGVPTRDQQTQIATLTKFVVELAAKVNR
ncbi:MAG: hypothetical protein ABI672_17260 [Vicinamibacteria bacterium]